MNDCIIRNPYASEIPALREIWRTVFGEEGEASFFGHFFSEELAAVAEREGRPAAMGYIVPMGELLAGKAALPCAMLYAIAVLPGHRGEGLGAAVTGRLISDAYAQGYPAVVLCPSEDSLFEYYSARTELRGWFFAGEKAISASSTFAKTLPAEAGEAGAGKAETSAYPDSAPQKSGTREHMLRGVTPSEYSEIRESSLKGLPHIRHSPAYLEYQKMLCGELGGGLYQIGNSCAVVEVQKDGTVWVKELLVSVGDDGRDVTCAITGAFPSHKYMYRFPAKNGRGRRLGMLAVQSGVPGGSGLSASETAHAPWYGLAFD